jgi:DNA-directed RNA polymerase specialized sigma24 family protein
LRSSLRDEEWRQQDDAADAEDLVQETFVRAMERPPADTARP